MPVNNDMRVRHVTQPADYFPVGDRSKQKKNDPKENMGPSLLDHPFFQEGRETGRFKKKVFQATRAEAVVLRSEKNFLSQAENFQGLKDHLDARIFCCFRQLVDCYDTPNVYEKSEVEDQAKSSEAIQWVCKQTKEKGTLKRESAHYGTIPCLTAYPRDAYEEWLEDDDLQKPKGKVYNKYSDTYILNNSCGGLLKVVNKADSLIDWEGGQQIVIRPFTMDLINKSATKEEDPLTAIRLYIGKLRQSIDLLAAQPNTPALTYIFETYQQHLNHVQEMIDERPNAFFKYILGVHLNEDDPMIVKLRDSIYPHRFRTMQKASEYQSTVSAHIEATRKKILGNLSFNMFDQAFKARLIVQAYDHSEKMGNIFRRHFSLNKQQAEQLWTSCFNPAKNHLLQQPAKAAIDKLIDKVEDVVHNLSVDVSLLRANLMKEMREMNAISQTALAKRINKIDRSAGLYQQQISRLERGEKRITDGLAESLSKVFNLHSSIFLTELV